MRATGATRQPKADGRGNHVSRQTKLSLRAPGDAARRRDGTRTIGFLMHTSQSIPSPSRPSTQRPAAKQRPLRQVCGLSAGAVHYPDLRIGSRAMIAPVTILQETSDPKEAATLQEALNALLGDLAPSIKTETGLSVAAFMEVRTLKCQERHVTTIYQVVLIRHDNAPPLSSDFMRNLERRARAAVARAARGEAARHTRPVAGNNFGRGNMTGAGRKWRHADAYR
jgi:hypothetical protein